MKALKKLKNRRKADRNEVFPDDVDAIVYPIDDPEKSNYRVQIKTRDDRVDDISVTSSVGVNDLFAYFCTHAINNARLPSDHQPELSPGSLGVMHAARNGMKIQKINDQYLLSMGKDSMLVSATYKPLAEGFVSFIKSIGAIDQLDRYWVE